MAGIALDRIVSNLTPAQLLKLGELQAKVDHLQNMPSFDSTLLEDEKYHKTINLLAGGETSHIRWDASVIKTKAFGEAVGNMTPQQLRDGMWQNVKHDDPDTLLVRHLEARDWDVDRALLMMLASVRWRNEQDVINGLLKGGDEGIRELSQSGEGKNREVASEVMAQLRSGKSFTHGTDKTGRPIVFIRVQKHDPSAQSLQGLEKYIIFQTESARMLMHPPVTDAAVIMDLGGFSMANMDWNAVKILTLGLEEKYPESVGVQYIYRAPWIISGIWNVVKKMMPGKEAQKVRFVKNKEELSQFIDLKYLPTEMGGTEGWEFEYIEPVAGENAHMKDTAKRNEIEQRRQALIDEFEVTTRQWLELLQTEAGPTNPNSSGASSSANSVYTAAESEQPKDKEASTAEEAMQRRRAVMAKLRENYWELDPYVRGKTQLDRSGLLDGRKPTSSVVANGV